MKTAKHKFIPIFLCIVILVFCMVVPASARASAYFDYTSVYVENLGGGTLNIQIHVLSTGTMQEVGASQITIYEKQSNGNYSPVFTFTRENYPSLITRNRISYITAVTYYGDPGKSYYALAAFYAKNTSGSQTLWRTSNTVNT